MGNNLCNERGCKVKDNQYPANIVSFGVVNCKSGYLSSDSVSLEPFVDIRSVVLVNATGTSYPGHSNNTTGAVLVCEISMHINIPLKVIRYPRTGSIK